MSFKTFKNISCLIWVLIAFFPFKNAEAQTDLRNLFFNSQTDIVRLDFSTVPPTPFATGIVGAYEGIAHFEDGDGNLLFWFNANGVYNQAGVLMTGSVGIFANSSSAEVSICPIPGETNRYYILYNAETCSNLYYSIVDMTLNGGLGDVTNLNTLIDSGNFSEGMEVVNVPDTDNFWFITYQCGTGIKRFLVDETGIDTGVVIHPYPMPPGGYDGRGELDYHRGKLGACFAWSSRVFIADFDPESGNLCNPIDLDDTAFANSPFGVEFSPGGNKMYFSLWYTLGQSNVFQYDIQSNTYQGYNPPLGGSVSNGLGEIELGRDGKLYIIEDGGNNILVIDNPDDDIPNFSSIPISSNTGLGISDHIQSYVFDDDFLGGDTLCVAVNTTHLLDPDNPGVQYEWYDESLPNDLIDTAETLEVEFGNTAATYIGYSLDPTACFTSVFEVTIIPIPDVDAGPDLSINIGESIVLEATASVNSTYTWVGPNLDDPFILNPTASPTETTTYFVSAANNVCQAVDQMTIFVTDKDIVQDTLCAVLGENLELLLPDTLVNSIWYNAADPNTNIGTGNSYNASATGSQFTIVGEGENPTITGGLIIQFTINVAPPINAGPDQTILEGETVDLLGSDAGSSGYYWYTNSGDDATISSQIDASPTVTPSQSTWYYLSSFNDPDCVEIDSARVNVLIESFQVDTICGIAGQSLTMQARGGLENITWAEAIDPLTVISAGGNYEIIIPTTPIVYVATGSESNGDILTQDFVIIPTPEVSAGTDRTIFEGETISLEGAGGASVEWTPSDGLSDPFSLNPTITPLENTTFLITSTDEFGCQTFDEVTITVRSEGLVLVPNAFSPNDDGNNDILRMVTFNIIELKSFRVYNRWGQEIFNTVQLSEGWDGSFNGENQELGTYVWVVEAVDKNSEEVKYTGNVALIR